MILMIFLLYKIIIKLNIIIFFYTLKAFLGKILRYRYNKTL